MAHVTIDGSGKITGIFALPQPQLTGYTEVSDTDPRVVAIVSAPPPKSQPSPRQWLERLAPATQAAITKAAVADSSGGLLLWLLKAAGNAQPIDVSSAETIAGVAALVSAGVITAQDQATLLAP